MGPSVHLRPSRRARSQHSRASARGRGRGSPAADTPGRGLPQLRGLFERLAREVAAASAPWQRPAEPPLRRMDARLPRWVDRSGGIDANGPDPDAAEIMRAMRPVLQSDRLRWTSGGHDTLEGATLLLEALRRGKGRGYAKRVALACPETARTVVRGVWFDGALACPSCRRQAQQQRPEQPADALHVLSSLLACDCKATRLGDTWSATRASDVHRLKALGNTVVPVITELLGRAVLESLEASPS
jgi:hypothetical protein